MRPVETTCTSKPPSATPSRWFDNRSNVPKDVVIFGSAGKEIEDMLRTSSGSISSAPLSELPRIARTPGSAGRVVVLDIRKHSELPPGLAALKSEQPATGVVIVADKLDPKLMLEGMRAGVSEWVVDPVTAAELLSAVDRAAGSAPKRAG